MPGVTDDWSHAVLCVPTPGKGRAHLKFMAEQVMRFIGSLGYSRVILKGDGEPSMRMLLEVLQQARLRLGFHTNIEISEWPSRFTGQWSCGERDPDGERHGEDLGAWCQRRLSDAHQAIFAGVALGYAPCWTVVDTLQKTRRWTNSL